MISSDFYCVHQINWNYFDAATQRTPKYARVVSKDKHTIEPSETILSFLSVLTAAPEPNLSTASKRYAYNTRTHTHSHLRPIRTRFGVHRSIWWMVSLHLWTKRLPDTAQWVAWIRFRHRRQSPLTEKVRLQSDWCGHSTNDIYIYSIFDICCDERKATATPAK